MTTLLSTSRRSADAELGGWRKAKQLVDRGPHFCGAGPSPIAPSMFSNTTSAPERKGLSAGARLSGSGLRPYSWLSVSAAYLAQNGSRFVPSVTSPPAHTLTDDERRLGPLALVASERCWADTTEAAPRSASNAGALERFLIDGRRTPGRESRSTSSRGRLGPQLGHIAVTATAVRACVGILSAAPGRA